LKLPNGQFPLKIPGPISQAKLKPKKKQIALYKKNLNGGVAILLKNRYVYSPNVNRKPEAACF
jgi:hypothetical protein